MRALLPARRLPPHLAWAVAAVLLLAAAAVAPASAQNATTATAANRRCTDCHGRPQIAELLPDERRVMLRPSDRPATEPEGLRPDLFVGVEALRFSVHENLRCVDCHADADALPHAAELQPPRCGSCHVSAEAAFDRSVHAEALAAGAPTAPGCVDCHGGHDILPSSHRNSLTHPLNVVDVCGDCHRGHSELSAGGWDQEQRVTSYLDSVHGQGLKRSGLLFAATCADCHRHHEVLPTSDPQSSTNRLQIPNTCGRCHLGVVETYQTSIHGMLMAEGDERGPVCTDCHTGHSITHAWLPESLVDIVAECGACHDDPSMSPGRRASFYKTYRASYHGQVTQLGSTRAARCSDCHGAHDILPIDHPKSRLHGDQLINTCRQCHEGAPASFASFDPHADFLDRDRYPLLHAVWWYFVIIMSAAFGFFGLHSLLWFIRSLIERRRNGPAPRFTANPHAVRRFTTLNRVNHGLLIISFFGLTLTGLPLLFSDEPWALHLAAFFGGGEVIGVLHRIFAVMLIANFVIHIVGLVRKAREHEGSIVRDWLLGPNSMLPRFRDVKDCAGMFRWFFRGGRKPRLDRWTYWEKFDYLAEIFGTLIIGGSGLLLWFPVFFSSFLPGWVFNVAMIVHGYEALLAVGFIFTAHFFNAHLRMEKFPVDDVIFTGCLPEEEFRHERPDEYERLEAQNRLEKLRVPPPPRWQRRLAVVVGITAMTVGFTLVGLIIAAGFKALG